MADGSNWAGAALARHPRPELFNYSGKPKNTANPAGKQAGGDPARPATAADFFGTSNDRQAVARRWARDRVVFDRWQLDGDIGAVIREERQRGRR